MDNSTLISIIILAIVIVLVIFGKSKSYDSCLTIDNFNLVKDSSITEFNNHKIERSDNQLKFSSSEGYTLFFVEKTSDKVILKGLASYGLQDRKFKKEFCELVKKVKNS